MLAQTRNGKQILNLKEKSKAKACVIVHGDHLACISENRKLLIFAISEIPKMARGKGVKLQKFKDGGLSDVKSVNLIEGMSWLDPAGRTRIEHNLSEWVGRRATSGRMAPRGFPKNNQFN